MSGLTKETGKETAVADLLPTASARRTGRAVVELVRPQRTLAILTIGVFVAESLVGLVGPLALGRIVDAVQQQRGEHPVVMASGVLLGSVLAQAVLTVLGLRLTARVGETALARLRERVIASAFALPAQRVEQVGAGDLAARIGDDATLVAGALRNVLPNVAGAALTIGFTVLGLTALDWRFALAGLCAMPIQAVTLRWYLRTSGPLYAAQRVAGGERTRQILESVSGVRTVRAFRLTERHTARVAGRSAAAMGYALRAVTLRSRFFGRLNSAEFTGLALILCVGYWLVHSDRAGVGEATAAALLFVRLFDPVNILLGLAATAQEAAAGLARLVGAADVTPEAEGEPQPVEGAPGTAPVPAPRATPDAGSGPDAEAGPEYVLDARDIHHAYVAGRPVLHGVSLRLAPGEQVTLVGTTGAGKSTLARIIAGVHPPTAGQVSVGARGQAGRPAVLLLDQDTHVFAGTVADNLLLARADADEDALEAALETAGALPWVRALPQELATRVGAGGVGLTPVQAQQLALARLALADPPVAVLDESAAEAGSEGARTLEAAARKVLAGRTALVVAHRLTQAATADRVVVMDDGRIVEEGPHSTLVAAGGPYAELWSAWSSRATAPAAPPS